MAVERMADMAEDVPFLIPVAIDDTPTARYGPEVEGAGLHHNPSPGHAGEKYIYGHVWVTVAALARHPDWDTIALPVQAQLYIRARDVEELPPDRRRPFQTKLEQAAGQLRWLTPWVANDFEERWAVVDGGYAKKPFLRAARKDGWVVIRPEAKGWPSSTDASSGPAWSAVMTRPAGPLWKGSSPRPPAGRPGRQGST